VNANVTTTSRFSAANPPSECDDSDEAMEYWKKPEAPESDVNLPPALAEELGRTLGEVLVHNSGPMASV
jgi:hypothetical protein